MTPKTRIKRTYNSSRRREQALQTRHQIVEAARSLFIERGYAGATMDAIAAQAGVAPETVYAAFGNKRAILSQLIAVSLVGDDQPVPLFKREGPLAVAREKNQRRQVELFVDDMDGIMSRMAPIFDLMRVAAKSDPEIAAMFQNILGERVQGMKFFVRALMRNGPLRDGLTLEAAAETVWALTSGEVFILLNVDRLWPKEKYKRWLADALAKLLLP